MKIITVYERLNGMQASYAAFLYIVDAQQSEGYGEEFFSAKDDESTEVKIGYSPEGLIVKRCHASNLKYRWNEIKDISHSKRSLHIKCKDSTIGIYILEDAEMARYVALVFCLQWNYGITEAIQQKAVPMSINNLQGAIRTFGAPQVFPPRCSNNDLRSANSIDLGSPTGTRYNGIQPYSSASTARATSSFNINSINPRNQTNSTVGHLAQSFQHPGNSGMFSHLSPTTTRLFSGNK